MNGILTAVAFHKISEQGFVFSRQSVLECTFKGVTVRQSDAKFLQRRIKSRQALRSPFANWSTSCAIPAAALFTRLPLRIVTGLLSSLSSCALRSSEIGGVLRLPVGLPLRPFWKKTSSAADDNRPRTTSMATWHASSASPAPGCALQTQLIL